MGYSVARRTSNLTLPPQGDGHNFLRGGMLQQQRILGIVAAWNINDVAQDQPSLAQNICIASQGC